MKQLLQAGGWWKQGTHAHLLRPMPAQPLHPSPLSSCSLSSCGSTAEDHSSRAGRGGSSYRIQLSFFQESNWGKGSPLLPPFTSSIHYPLQTSQVGRMLGAEHSQHPLCLADCKEAWGGSSEGGGRGRGNWGWGELQNCFRLLFNLGWAWGKKPIDVMIPNNILK